MKRVFVKSLLVFVLLFSVMPVGVAAKGGNVGVNITLTADATTEVLQTLRKFGSVLNVFDEIDVVVMRVKVNQIDQIEALPFVISINQDAERLGAPISTVSVSDFEDGMSTWNLDVINVTNVGFNNRTVEYTGEGVYIAVLDTGMRDSWRKYFPEERIAVEYAKSFGGGGGFGVVSEQPNKWEHDVNGHGMHVASTILGYSLGATPINGVAPLAKVIPVKVMNQNGRGWSSVITQGILYVTELKKGPLADHPVIINMSLGGPVLDGAEKAAIDYAIENGVIIVASAGNNGENGMGYPGAYEPVISVAASGWASEWLSGAWWYAIDDPDPNVPELYYITDFSSRAKEGQDLDVAAPGSYIVGPYQLNSGNRLSYFYLGGTSMAAPHVSGVVALMAQKYPALTAFEAEEILENTATYLAPGSTVVYSPYGTEVEYSWNEDATGSGIVNAMAALEALDD